MNAAAYNPVNHRRVGGVKQEEYKMKHKTGKTLALLLSLVMLVGLLPGLTTTALADGTTSYTLVIPSSLTVNNSGWNNATSGISATGTLESGKKLTVTASSANSWALKQQDGSETVDYTMKETADGAAKTAWEFTALPGNATLGIDVADYSTKPAGTYQDTVTFTAKVEDAKPEYYDKLVECGCDGNLDGIIINGGPGTYLQQTITAAQAIALAKAKAAETGSNCAVFYGPTGMGAGVWFAKNDGTTGSTEAYYTAADKGLTGYRGYYVSK
jgi:hypothetical protein